MIRRAHLADRDAIVAMGTRFLASVYSDRIRPDAATLARTASQLLTSPDAIVFVAEQAGVLVGMIGLMVFWHPMSGELTATEVMWWVEPSARGIGLRLLKQGQAWAMSRDATTLQLIAPSDETEQLYARMGLQPVERVYQRRFA